MSTPQTGGPKPSRRTLVKGAAWSVPVVAVAGAAPALAASPGCTETGLCFGGAGIHKCCDAGDKYYWADISFTNSSNVDTTVAFSFTLVTSANGTLSFSGGGPVAANSTATFRVTSALAGNCSQGTYAAFTINFQDSTGATGTAVVPGGSTGGSVCPGTSTTASRESTSAETSEQADSTTRSAQDGVVVPDVVGQNLMVASLTLGKVGLTMNPDAATGTILTQDGTILTQDPAAGESVAPGTVITVTTQAPTAAETDESAPTAEVIAPAPDASSDE